MKKKASRLVRDLEEGLKSLQEHNRGGRQLRVTTLSRPEAPPAIFVSTKAETAYLALFERGPLGWAAYVPDLPGCVAKGATVEEAEANVRMEIVRYIEAAVAGGETVPLPAARAKIVLVAA